MGGRTCRFPFHNQIPPWQGKYWCKQIQNVQNASRYGNTHGKSVQRKSHMMLLEQLHKQWKIRRNPVRPVKCAAANEGTPLVRKVLKELYDEMGHQGVDRTTSLNWDQFYQPYMQWQTRGLCHKETCVCETQKAKPWYKSTTNKHCHCSVVQSEAALYYTFNLKVLHFVLQRAKICILSSQFATNTQ